MACFPRISGYKKITFCRICNAKMIDAKTGEYYCKVCIKKMNKGRKEKTAKKKPHTKSHSKSKK